MGNYTIAQTLAIHGYYTHLYKYLILSQATRCLHHVHAYDHAVECNSYIMYVVSCVITVNHIMISYVVITKLLCSLIIDYMTKDIITGYSYHLIH